MLDEPFGKKKDHINSHNIKLKISYITYMVYVLNKNHINHIQIKLKLSYMTYMV